jgi:fructose-bisphosphate aldolase, class II
MPLVGLADLLNRAKQNRHGLGAFNVIQLEHAEAIVAGAAAADAPVVMQISENTIGYHGSATPILAACLRLGEEAPVPVTVHLDHASSFELVQQAVRNGVHSVMFDASSRPHQDNVEATAEVVRWCHARGVSVEAELGEVGGKDGVHGHGARTDPSDAAWYVDATDVDALAVAVGSSHAMTTRDAVLDDHLISRIAEAVPVPLVLHGSSGVPDDGLRSAVAAGIVKVNIATHLNARFTAAVRERLAADETLVDPRKYLGPGREAMSQEVGRLLGVLGAAGMAVRGSGQPS